MKKICKIPMRIKLIKMKSLIKINLKVKLMKIII